MHSGSRDILRRKRKMARIRGELLRVQKLFPNMELASRRRDVGLEVGDPPEFTSYLEGPITSNQGRSYKISLLLNEYPQAMPVAYISYPPLRQYDGTSLASIGGNRAMHTLPPDAYGHIQMCLVNDKTWRTTTTLLSLVMRARVWVEAYEAYLDTGESLDHLLGHG